MFNQINPKLHKKVSINKKPQWDKSHPAWERFILLAFWINGFKPLFNQRISLRYKTSFSRET